MLDSSWWLVVEALDLARASGARTSLVTNGWAMVKKPELRDAILAREPFTAAKRVKFQNLVQDLSDKLTDARIPADAPPKTQPRQ